MLFGNAAAVIVVLIIDILTFHGKVHRAALAFTKYGVGSSLGDHLYSPFRSDEEAPNDNQI